MEETRVLKNTWEQNYFMFRRKLLQYFFSSLFILIYIRNNAVISKYAIQTMASIILFSVLFLAIMNAAIKQILKTLRKS